MKARSVARAAARRSVAPETLPLRSKFIAVEGTQLSYRALSRSVGAELRGVCLRERQSNCTLQAIKALWDKYLVLIVRGQEGLSPSEQVAFCHQLSGAMGVELGRCSPGICSGNFAESLSRQPMEGNPYIRCFSNLKDGSPVPEERNNGFKVTAQWHSDGSYRPIPDHACAIFAERVAEWGGQTCWANLFAAYRSLPDRLKELLEGPEAQCSATESSPPSAER